MDLATLLSRVDARAYATTHQFLADVAKIPQVCGWMGGRAMGGTGGGRRAGGEDAHHK